MAVSEAPKHIQLIEKRETKTSRGILSKGWYEVDGKLVMVKGNSITEAGIAGLEPYSEVMASKIAAVLGIDHVDYQLMDAALFPDITTHACPHVSVCENFLQPGERLYHFADMLDSYCLINDVKSTPDTAFHYALELYGEDWLDKMLVFDAFIGNEDRHENNFDVIVKGAERKAPPLYDNGAGLLAWAAEDELADTKLRYEFDRSKPFRSHHAKQIKLVGKPVLPVTDSDTLYQEVLAAIQPTLTLLSEKRAAAICTYLKYRLRYLQAAMG